MEFNLGVEYLIYEHDTLQTLIATEKSNQSIIKKYWKKFKGKSELPDDSIKGYMLIPDEEQESLKIDFSRELNFEIKYLKKFG